MQGDPLLMHRPGEYIGTAADGVQPVDDGPARFCTFPNLMPAGYTAEIIGHGVREVIMDPAVGNFQNGSHAEISDTEHDWMLTDLRDAMRARFDEAAKACGYDDAPPADEMEFELWLSVRGEGGVFHWHTDRDPKPVQTRWLSLCYYMHTHPLRFMGGELEFYDGQQVLPADNLLACFDSRQTHRVRHVHAVPFGTCTKENSVWPDPPALAWPDARWSVTGWAHSLHVPPPE